MKHQDTSALKTTVRLWAGTLCAACVPIVLCITGREAGASIVPPFGDETGFASIIPRTYTWEFVARVSKEADTSHAEPSLPGAQEADAPASPAVRSEEAGDSLPSSPWDSRHLAHFNCSPLLRSPLRGDFGQMCADALARQDRSPVVPVSSPPSSELLFLTGLVGLIGSASRRQSLITDTKGTGEEKPDRLCDRRMIVVLSHDPLFAGDLETHLQQAGYTVRVARTVGEVFAVTSPASLLLVLVDSRIEDWDLLRTDSSFRHVVLMAVVPFDCRSPEDHWISILLRGIDGVHDMREGHRLLIAKVGAYLRRAGVAGMRRGVYQVGAVILDGDAHEVHIAGRRLRLSAKPFAILAVLIGEPSKVFSRTELLDLVWGRDFAVSEHTVDVHIHALRQQLSRAANSFCELVTVNRVGFKLKPSAPVASIGREVFASTSSSLSSSRGNSRKAPSVAAGRACLLSTLASRPPATRVLRRHTDSAVSAIQG